MSHLSRRVVLSILVGALWLAGCGQAVQKAVEQASGVQVDKKGDISINKDGQQVVISQQLPEDLRGFPAPQGFALAANVSASVAGRGEKGSMASWTGKGTAQAVADFYKRTMPEQGWKQELALESGAGGQLGFSKGDNVVMILTDQRGDEVTLSVILTKSAQQQQAAAPTSVPAAAKPAAAVPTPPPAPAVASPTPVPPLVSDSSVLPPELRDFPVATGFAVEKDTVQRMVVGGVFAGATATWVGKADVKEVGAFYKRSLVSKGWKEQEFAETESDVLSTFTSSDGSLNLGLLIGKDDGVTRVQVALTK